MQKLRNDGLSFQRIADKLNRDGLKPRAAETWYPSSVQAILKANACTYPLYKNPLEAGHRTPLLCKTGHRHCINPTHLEWETVAAGAVRRERDERWLAYRKEHGGTAEDAGVLEAKETTGKLTGKERG